MTAKWIGSALLILALICTLGCRGKSDPTTPVLERTPEDFAQNAAAVFGPDTEIYDGITFDPHYHDVATCQIMTVGTAGGTPGTPWSGDDNDAFHGCAMVTLNRPDDNVPTGTFHPVFRWLDSNNYTVNGSARNGGPFLVTGWDANDPDWKTSDTDFRAVSCDAAYDPTGWVLTPWEPIKNRTIELVVCYEILNAPGIGNTDWDIGVTALQWIWDGVEQPWDWYNDQPTYRYDVVFPDGGAEKDDTNPDIAYNHGDPAGAGAGDVYLAYSSGEFGPAPTYADVAYIKYRHFRRLVPSINLPEYLAQTPDHNGHDPSIDVDWFQVGVDIWNSVAIAYTSQYQTDSWGWHNAYHVCLTAWRTAWPDQIWPTFMSLRNPDTSFNTLNGGLPSLDIAPNANEIHNGIVAYTQEAGSDGFGSTTAVYVTQISWPIPAPPIHIIVAADDVGTEDLADGLYPSAVINRQGDSVVNASISFMAQRAQDNVLHPYAARVQLRPTFIVSWWDVAALDLPVIIGNYNISEIPFINPGVSSSIAPDVNNNYWAAWCDRTEMEPPPQTVSASWGFTG